jgi:hypothetical protein
MMGANAPGDAMELVSVEVALDTGKTIGEDGRAFRPAIITVMSVDEFAPAAVAAMAASSAPATQLIPNTARRTRITLMLFYPESGAFHPCKRQTFFGDPECNRLR